MATAKARGPSSMQMEIYTWARGQKNDREGYGKIVDENGRVKEGEYKAGRFTVDTELDMAAMLACEQQVEIKSKKEEEEKKRPSTGRSEQKQALAPPATSDNPPEEKGSKPETADSKHGEQFVHVCSPTDQQLRKVQRSLCNHYMTVPSDP